MPEVISIEYGKDILLEVKEIDKLVEKHLIPQLQRISTGERFDDIEFKHLAGVVLVAAIIIKIKSLFYNETLSEEQEPNQLLFSKFLKRIIRKFTSKTKAKASGEFAEEYSKQLGTLPPKFNYDEFIEDATKKNIALIKTIPQQHFSKIQTYVEEVVDKGKPSSEITKKLLEISDISKKRARLIAVDQTQKLQATLNEARQRSLGVDEYIWDTMQDSRVRSFANSRGQSDHARLHGTVQRWQNPPVVTFKGKYAGERAHPGQSVNCRCVASPIYKE